MASSGVLPLCAQTSAASAARMCGARSRQSASVAARTISRVREGSGA